VWEITEHAQRLAQEFHGDQARIERRMREAPVVGQPGADGHPLRPRAVLEEPDLLIAAHDTGLVVWHPEDHTYGLVDPEHSWSDIQAMNAEADPGGSSPAPYAIARRYAAGKLSRAEALDQLVRWPYDEGPGSAEAGAGCDDGTDPRPGTWLDLVNAYEDGLIDEDLFDQVVQLAHARRRP